VQVVGIPVAPGLAQESPAGSALRSE
jgi:hypothetical protein